MRNRYDLAHRGDDALVDDLAAARFADVPFIPLGGFSPPQPLVLDHVAVDLGAAPMQVALAWLPHRAPNVLSIPGTPSVAHLRESLAAADLALPVDARAAPDAIGAPATGAP